MSTETEACTAYDDLFMALMALTPGEDVGLVMGRHVVIEAKATESLGELLVEHEQVYHVEFHLDSEYSAGDLDAVSSIAEVANRYVAATLPFSLGENTYHLLSNNSALWAGNGT